MKQISLISLKKLTFGNIIENNLSTFQISVKIKPICQIFKYALLNSPNRKNWRKIINKACFWGSSDQNSIFDMIFNQNKIVGYLLVKVFFLILRVGLNVKNIKLNYF